MKIRPGFVSNSSSSSFLIFIHISGLPASVDDILKAYGLTYIGGTLKGKISLHSAVTGKRVTQSAKGEDCTLLTRIAWRTTRYAGTGRRHSSPGLNWGSPAC